MTGEEILEKTLSLTIERLGKQAINYETEIANLNARILILNDQIKSLTEEVTEKEDLP